MKNKLLAFAGAAAIIAAMGHFYAKPLMAQVRAALIKNIDERGRAPYFQSQVCFQSNSNSCTAFFSAVPANYRLVVEHINMSLDTPTAFSHVDVYGNGSIIESALLTLQGKDATGNNIYVANQPFLAYYEAGQTPSCEMVSQSGGFEFMSGQVTLSGYLVNLSE